VVLAAVSTSSGGTLTDYFRRDMETQGEAASHYRYLLGDAAVPTFFGRGAEALGLSERDATPGIFGKLCAGIGPNGERLRQNAGQSQDAAWDITLNFSKSVSLAALLGSDKSRSCIQNAATETMEKLARHVESSVAQTRRGKGGRTIESVAGLVMVGFWHIESRYGDPHLHCHLLVFNACLRHDGTWGAVHSKPLYRSKMALGALASAEMATQLRAEGLDIVAARDGFEIRGISESVRRAFSKGRERILKFAEERGYGSAKALESINRRLRPAKVNNDRVAQLAAWRETAASHGVTPEHIQNLFGRPRAVHLARLRGNARRATRGAVAWLTEHTSTFRREDVLRLAANACRGGHAPLDAIVRATDEQLRHDSRILWLGERHGQAIYAARQNLDLERRAIHAAKVASSDRAHVMKSATVKNAAVAHGLDEEQAAALEEIARGPGAVRLIRGGAGTGKTRLLAALAAAAESEGHRVIGLAPTGVAREGLSVGARIDDAFTVAKFRQVSSPSVGLQVRHGLRMLARTAVKRGTWKLPRIGLQKGDHVIVDEAAMVGFRDLAKLIRQTRRAGAKLILCGDDRQLGPVEAGASLFAELGRELGATELRTNWRQRGSLWMQRLNWHLAARESDEAIRLLVDQERLHVATGDENPLRACVDRYLGCSPAVRRSTMVIGATRAQVAVLNESIQAARLEQGELTGTAARLRVDAAGTMQGGDDVQELRFHIGDRVVLRRNQASVLLRDARKQRPLESRGVVNGDFGAVTAVHGTRLRVLLDRKGPEGESMVADIDLRDYSNIELGYAATAYRVQGKTVKQSLVLADPGSLDAQLAYVALTRQSDDLHVFAHEVAVGEEFADLSRALSRTRQLEAAVTEQRLCEEEQRQAQQLSLGRSY